MEKYFRAGQDTDDIMGKCSAFCIDKATSKHSDYVISFAFPLQQRFYESTSISI